MRRGIERVGRDIELWRAQKMCLNKKTFFTRNEARDFAARVVKKYEFKQSTPYHCRICGNWHLTTLDKDAFKYAREQAWK